MGPKRLRLMVSRIPDSSFESGIPDQNLRDLKETVVGDNTKVIDTLGISWSVQPRKRGSAQIRVWISGKPFSISTGQKSVAALSKATQIRLIQDWLKRNPVVRQEAATFEGEVKRFLSLKYEGRRPRTVEAVRRDLERLQEVLGVTLVKDATKARCEARKDAMRGEMAPATWRDFLSRAAKFFRWQVAEKNLESDPLVNFRRPVKKEFGRREDVWDSERFEKTLALLSGEDREMLVIFRETGMDPADLFHFDPKKNLVEASEGAGKFWKIRKVREKAKSDAECVDQPLSTAAKAILLPRRGNWYDLSRYGSAASFGCAIRKRIKAAQVKAGYSDPLAIKALRHTFATYHATRYLEGRGGPPMEVLRKWMGHAPSSRTLEAVYMHTQSSGRYQE